MPDKKHDLLINAGRVFCPSLGWMGPGSVAVCDGRIVEVDCEVHGSANRILDFPDGLLLPGLIDIHAHPACSGSVFGVEPDRYMLANGVTTVMSQGDAGAGNLESYIQETIQSSQTRVCLAINLSRLGESTEAGCFACLADADVGACVAAIEKYREHIWGIAVNTSHHACGDSDPREILQRGLEVAERTGLPILFGMRRTSDWSFDDQLKRLRAGDVVTYCFRKEPHCIIENSRVHPAIREARERGILFDVGHGSGSFCFDVAEAAIREGFFPDTISTDLQTRHLNSTPFHTLPLVVSKLRAAGMPEENILRAVTQNPARVLRLDDEIGTLESGMTADLTVLQWSPTKRELKDTGNTVRQVGCWESQLTVRGGEVIPGQS
jgi:dihydroorotase